MIVAMHPWLTNRAMPGRRRSLPDSFCPIYCKSRQPTCLMSLRSAEIENLRAASQLHLQLPANAVRHRKRRHSRANRSLPRPPSFFFCPYLITDLAQSGKQQIDFFGGVVVAQSDANEAAMIS